MTDDKDLIPPTFTFDIDQFRNPRSTAKSTPWNITIYSEFNKILYQWRETNLPYVKMDTAAKPKAISFTRESEQNGAITNYEITVQTTNYLIENDQLLMKMPFPVYFSEDTECIGRSVNLRNVLPCEVSIDLTRVEVNLTLPLPRLGRNL